jgi:hypothetical protein
MRTFAVVFALAAAGCGGQAPDPEVEAAAQQSVVGVEGSLRSAQFMGPFQPSSELAALSPDEARRRALADVIETYEAAIQRAECIELATDEETYLEITFDGCRLGLLGLYRLDGTIRGELDIELEECDAGQCLAAVIYDVRVVGLEIRAQTETAGLVMEGAWTYRAPVEPSAEPMALAGEVSYSGPRGASLEIESDSTWRVDGACVTLSSDGRIRALDEDDELLGGVVISAVGVERCGAQCPEAGTVNLAFARGDVLTWTYTGQDAVTVRAPGGDEYDVVLDCTP